MPPKSVIMNVGLFIFAILILAIIDFVIGTVHRANYRRKALKNLTISKGSISGVELPDVDSATLELPIHKYITFLTEWLLFGTIIAILMSIDEYAKLRYIGHIPQFFMFISLWCIYISLRIIYNQPLILIDRIGIHTAERLHEKCAIFNSIVLVLLLIIYEIFFVWNAYQQYEVIGTVPFASILYFILNLVIAYFILKHLPTYKSLIKSYDVFKYDSIEDDRLLNTIGWDDINKVEYTVSRSKEFWEIIKPREHLVEFSSVIRICFKGKTMKDITLDLNEGMNFGEIFFPIYRLDPRILLPLAAICKENGVKLVVNNNTITNQ